MAICGPSVVHLGVNSGRKCVCVVGLAWTGNLREMS